jgi:macrodomain Ter protein organizer (MatP/YcbG family)
MSYTYNYTIDNLEYTDSGEVSKAVINYFGTCNRTGKTPIRHKEKLEVTFEPVKNTDISSLNETTVRSWIDEQLTTEIVNNVQSRLRTRLDKTVNELNTINNSSLKKGLPFAETLTDSEKFEIVLNLLRIKRNKLLQDTDHYALSDQTLSDDMRTYRQALRDITNNLNTVEDVNSVTWPTKPGV